MSDASPYRFEWDEDKAKANLTKHGVAFDTVYGMDMNSAFVTPDLRHDYEEERWVAMGFIGHRLHVLVYTWRREAIRCISLRKANLREIERYEKEQF